MTPESSRKLSRRDALKTIGTGALVLGLGVLTGRAADTALGNAGPTSGNPANTSGSTSQPFALPKLPYAYEALEPHIDARTMEIHHSKHHQAYITNANKALADHADLQNRSAEDLLKNLSSVPENIRTAVRNNVGGHLNHSFFWQLLGPGGDRNPQGEVGSDIAQSFGSFSAFQSKFTEEAIKRFGSGWAWLSVKDGRLQVHSTANQDSPLMEGATPVLGLDVWEHAYYLHYQNWRADYVAAFWNVVNWAQVSKNYAAARA